MIPFAFLLFAPLTVLTAPGPAANLLIVPGRSVGAIRLGAAPGKAGLPTAPPAASDAAMLKAWATWYGAPGTGGNRSAVPTELDVYTAPPAGDDGSHKAVQLVRATSPWFRLAGGLRVGASLRAIRAAHGALPLAATYRLPGGLRYLYDDAARGIAFETDGPGAGSTCRAIVVHLPGPAAQKNYAMMGNYLKNLPPAPMK